MSHSDSMKSSNLPRITFGIIVLNGEPFTKYCLRSIYPFAHQIIVVEGGTRNAIDYAPQGHSTDDTLKALYEFKEREDPDNKLKIITKGGFWSEKDEMVHAYTERITGDYIWHVDIDEFYRYDDMKAIIEMLTKNPSIDTISFKMRTFWARPEYWVDGYFLNIEKYEIYHRLFRWQKGYKMTTHRPPTVCDEKGVDLRKRRWIKGHDTANKGIYLYHYSLLFPKQVKEKSQFYARIGWKTHPLTFKWFQDCYMDLSRPFHVHNVYTRISWLDRFNGKHPEEIKSMMDDIGVSKIKIKLRRTGDIERLLDSPGYQITRFFLKHVFYIVFYLKFLLGSVLFTSHTRKSKS